MNIIWNETGVYHHGEFNENLAKTKTSMIRIRLERNRFKETLGKIGDGFKETLGKIGDGFKETLGKVLENGLKNRK